MSTYIRGVKMNRNLPVQLKILIGLNLIVSLSSLFMLGFYFFNNVISYNGNPVEPLKLFYTIVFFIGIIMISLFLFTKKAAVIIAALDGVLLIPIIIGLYIGLSQYLIEIDFYLFMTMELKKNYF